MSGLLTEIDHVAIALRDLDAAVAWYDDVLGATVVHREVVASDGVEEALVQVAAVLRPAAHPDDAPTRRSPGSSTDAARGCTTSRTASTTARRPSRR